MFSGGLLEGIPKSGLVVGPLFISRSFRRRGSEGSCTVIGGVLKSIDHEFLGSFRGELDHKLLLVWKNRMSYRQQ